MLDFALLLLFCFLGVCTGILTGILPGLHVNNIALILLSLSGAFIAFCSPLLSYGITEQYLIVLLCGFIISVSISHSFHDTLPTTFLGAPEEDTALTVLPAHQLLLQGEGYKAVALSAISSFGAIMVCMLLLYPLRFILSDPLYLYATLREIMVWVLIAIVVLMIATEKARIPQESKPGKLPYFFGMLFAFFIFLLSGVFGLLIFQLPVDSPLGLSAAVLFPALAGLFGMPTLLMSLVTKPHIPEQRIEPVHFTYTEKKSSVVSVITGSLAGILVSIIPGITSATGTVIAMNARKQSTPQQTIVTLSAVNTACAFSVIAALFIILRPRSGATLAINELISLEPWSSFLLPNTLAYFLMFLIFAGLLSYFFTLYFGKVFAKKFSTIPYALLVQLTIVFIVILVFLFTGILGLFVLLTATCIGLIPLYWGIRRSHCMGILLLPIILYFI